MTSRGESTPAAFSLEAGGPFYRLQVALGFFKPSASRRAVLSTLLTWFPLLVLSAAQGMATGDAVRVPFLKDFAAYARFLVAIPLLIVAEALIGREMAAVVAHFGRSGLVLTVLPAPKMLDLILKMLV